jgi:Mor family transcriptional regulator
MSIFRDLARAMLLSPSFLEQMTDIFAQEIEKQARQQAGGDTIYIPKQDRRVRRIRDEQINAEFTGDNLEELAKKYLLTTRQLRRIVAKKMETENGG